MKRLTLKVSLAIAAMALMSLPAIAQDGQQALNEQGMLYAPLVYENHGSATMETSLKQDKNNGIYSLDAGDEWLQEAIENADRTRQVRQRTMIENPQLVAYNDASLPVAPPEGVIPADPKQGMLTIVPAQVEVENVTPPEAPDLPIHNWLHVFSASLQFTQAYISGNWYQGGENNLLCWGQLTGTAI